MSLIFYKDQSGYCVENILWEGKGRNREASFMTLAKVKVRDHSGLNQGGTCGSGDNWQEYGYIWTQFTLDWIRIMRERDATRVTPTLLVWRTPKVG